MASTLHWTSADLVALPHDEWTRYEIIGGKLFVSKHPHFYHQHVCGNVYLLLETWSARTELGQTIFAPGLIFTDDDDVVPDVAWLSNQRLAEALGSDGKLHSPPDLIIEVLSPGAKNERRDREVKMGLYSRRGVREYWILDWKLQSIEVFRSKNDTLAPVAVLVKGDQLESPLLPGFSVAVDELFIGAHAG